MKVAELHGKCHRMSELKDATVLGLLEDLDSFRRPEILEGFVLACEADARGRTGLEDQPYPQADMLRQAYQAAAAVNAADLDLEGLGGRQIGDKIRLERQLAIGRQRSS